MRAALHWNEQAWPWAPYAPAVMAAVAAGVPVLGANLPRDQMRAAMVDASLEGTLDAAAVEAQREADPGRPLRPAAGSISCCRWCGCRSRATGPWRAPWPRRSRPGQVVVLLSGAGHADPALGVPRHLPPALAARPVQLERPPGAAAKDYCAELREQLRAGAARSSAARLCRRVRRPSGGPAAPSRPQALALIESASVFTSWSMCDFSTM